MENKFKEVVKESINEFRQKLKQDNGKITKNLSEFKRELKKRSQIKLQTQISVQMHQSLKMKKQDGRKN